MIIIMYLSSACMYPLFICSLQVYCFRPGLNDDQTYTDEFNEVYCTSHKRWSVSFTSENHCKSWV